MLIASFGLVTASPCLAAAEPLIVTKLREPDPDLEAQADRAAAMDQAIQDFGLAISQTLEEQRQELRAKCNSIGMTSASASHRWAWAATCRYQRR